MMTMMMMMVKPVLAIELRAIPPQSTPQPHLLHRPDNDAAEVNDDENVDDDVDEDNDDVDVDEDDDEPAKQLDHRTVQPLYTRR